MTARVLWYHRGTKPMAAIYPDDIAGTNPLRELSSVANLTPMHWVHAGSRPARATYPDDATAQAFTYTDPDARTARVLWFHTGKGALTVTYPDALDAGGGEEYEGPLDIVPGAVVAYGQTALAAAMIGESYATLHRWSDDEELEFDFDEAGDAPEADIITWHGQDGSVGKTWSDQSGNAKHATQADSGKFPGWLDDALNGGPSFVFSAADQLSAPAVSFPGPAYTMFLVANVTAGAPVLYLEEGANYLSVNLASGQVVVETYFDASGNGAGGVFDVAEDLSVGYHLIEAAWEHGSKTVLVNGVAGTLSQDRDGVGPSEAITGTLNIGTTNFAGEVVAAIVYNSLLTAPNRLAIRQNMQARHGTPALP